MNRTLMILTLCSFACTPTPNGTEEQNPTPGASPPPNSMLTLKPSNPEAPGSETANTSNEPAPAITARPDTPTDAPSTAINNAQRIQIEVSSRFFSANGQQAQLIVKDQNGNPIAPERLRFVSSRSQDFRVDAKGNV